MKICGKLQGDDKLDKNVTICHMKLGENAGKLLVDIAREAAYYTKTYNDGLVVLFQSGIENYEICEKILKGKLTLKIGEHEGHQVFVPIEDNWKPPEFDMPEPKMRDEVEEYCYQMLHYPYAGVPAWRIMHNEQEIACIELEVGLLREVAKINPRKAYKEMLLLKQHLIDDSNERASESARISAQTKNPDRKVSIEHGAVSIQITKRAKQHLEPCNDTECRYSQKPIEYKENVCCFGARTNKGCIRETPELEENLDVLLALASMPVESKFLDTQIRKQFHFVYKGHEYTYKDSARLQNQCPHCDKYSISNNMVDPIKDDEAGTFKFIGFKQTADDECVVCFECQECFEKLFYHEDYIRVMQYIDMFPELKDKFDGFVMQ